jgi:cellulose synthase operon protein YhjQ
MSVVVVASMKGGVGKTTTTANLAFALASLGRPVLVVDLDPQNSLGLHFGLDGANPDGLARAALDGRPWHVPAVVSESGVLCLPYGLLRGEDVARFERRLNAHPERLAECLRDACAAESEAIVLIDTPPGPSPYLKAAFECADLALLVLLADAGSYATLPAMEAWVGEWQAQREGLQVGYLLNQTDATAPLARDVAEVLRHRLASRVLPVDIHRDEAIGEALAVQRPVLEYDPHCQAALDFRRLASTVLRQLP